MRLPKEIYFNHGFIKFQRHQDKILYTVWKYTEDWSTCGTTHSGIYTGQTKQEMLKLVE